MQIEFEMEMENNAIIYKEKKNDSNVIKLIYWIS